MYNVVVNNLYKQELCGYLWSRSWNILQNETKHVQHEEWNKEWTMFVKTQGRSMITQTWGVVHIPSKLYLMYSVEVTRLPCAYSWLCRSSHNGIRRLSNKSEWFLCNGMMKQLNKWKKYCWVSGFQGRGPVAFRETNAWLTPTSFHPFITDLCKGLSHQLGISEITRASRYVSFTSLCSS